MLHLVACCSMAAEPIRASVENGPYYLLRLGRRGTIISLVSRQRGGHEKGDTMPKGYETHRMRDGSYRDFDNDSDDAYDAWKDGELAQPSPREERLAREERVNRHYI